MSDPIKDLASRTPRLRLRDSAHMLRIALLLLQRATNKRGPLWATVSEVTMHGSGFSREICDALGLDPDAPYTTEALERALEGAMADPFRALPVVGRGPKFASTVPTYRWRRWLRQVAAVGDTVHVLLDDGRIVETTIRALVHSVGRSGAGCRVWLDGVASGYADGRVRPRGGWWRFPGCEEFHDV